MTIDFVTLLHQSDSLLLFVVLAFGLLLGKVRIGNFQIGNTIGVLFTALLFGQMGFQFSTSTENVGFMLFIFCVGIEAGPHFFSVFLRDGIHYNDLSDEQKRQLEEDLCEDESKRTTIAGKDIGRRIFSESTDRIILENLINNGIKDDTGSLVGKTIVFAQRQDHAGGAVGDGHHAGELRPVVRPDHEGGQGAFRRGHGLRSRVDRGRMDDAACAGRQKSMQRPFFSQSP